MAWVGRERAAAMLRRLERHLGEGAGPGMVGVVMERGGGLGTGSGS